MTAVVRHFTEKQIVDAKDALWKYCGSELIGEKKRKAE